MMCDLDRTTTTAYLSQDQLANLGRYLGIKEGSRKHGYSQLRKVIERWIVELNGPS